MNDTVHTVTLEMDARGGVGFWFGCPAPVGADCRVACNVCDTTTRTEELFDGECGDHRLVDQGECLRVLWLHLEPDIAAELYTGNRAFSPAFPIEVTEPPGGGDGAGWELGNTAPWTSIPGGGSP